VEGIWITEVEEPGEGVRLAVKDLIDTAGLTTTYGSVLFADHVPAETAESVRRLEAAGYAIAGKANLHEFAYGVTSLNPHFGAVPNPLAPGRLPGGSSGGSAAALATGEADAALGTDTGGSIRIPAACCGIVGLKPTYGLVSAAGVFPLAPSFDHVGPMARDVVTCEAMLAALVSAFTSRSLDSLDEVTAAVAWLDEADPLVRARVEEAASIIPQLRAVDLPISDDFGEAFMREIADVHRALFADSPDAYGEDVRAKLERCLAITDGEYDRAVRARGEYIELVTEALDGVDVLITPTLVCVAPPVDTVIYRGRHNLLTRLTFPINALGWPALALPCGPAEDGLPASLQLVARPGEDAFLLAVGRLVEAELASLDRGTAGQ
jgi:Asp-tRNA(Asn)/Glu-tRNA(Gln) amidotransferase A subunit family amidase